MSQCNQKRQWENGLDHLTVREFDEFLNHAVVCSYHEERLIEYEESVLPLLKAALPDKAITANSASLRMRETVAAFLNRLGRKLTALLRNPFLLTKLASGMTPIVAISTLILAINLLTRQIDQPQKEPPPPADTQTKDFDPLSKSPFIPQHARDIITTESETSDSNNSSPSNLKHEQNSNSFGVGVKLNTIEVPANDKISPTKIVADENKTDNSPDNLTPEKNPEQSYNQKSAVALNASPNIVPGEPKIGDSSVKGNSAFQTKVFSSGMQRPRLVITQNDITTAQYVPTSTETKGGATNSLLTKGYSRPTMRREYRVAGRRAEIIAFPNGNYPNLTVVKIQLNNIARGNLKTTECRLLRRQAEESDTKEEVNYMVAPDSSGVCLWAVPIGANYKIAIESPGYTTRVLNISVPNNTRQTFIVYMK